MFLYILNMQLLLSEIKHKLIDRKVIISKNDLYFQLTKTIKLTNNLMEVVILNDYMKLQVKNKIGKSNPLKWIFGNILFFWQNNCCRYLNIDYKYIDLNIYDNYKSNYNNRFF